MQKLDHGSVNVGEKILPGTLRRKDITDDLLNERGDEDVHIIVGPNSWCFNTMYLSPRKNGFLDEERRQSDKFCSGRWTLKEAYEHTKEYTRHPATDVWFEFAEPITFDPCPFCGHPAVLDEPRHGERWGTWDRSIICSSSHCRASITLPHPFESQEERLASQWNRRQNRRS